MFIVNTKTAASKSKLLLKSQSECTCLGDTLTFECTVEGEAYGITVWHGSAFSKCLPGQEISLLHSQFTGSRTARRDCNNGLIVAQSITVKNGFYVSQLNITVTSDVIGKKVLCAYDTNSNFTTIGSLNLAISGKIFLCSSD